MNGAGQEIGRMVHVLDICPAMLKGGLIECSRAVGSFFAGLQLGGANLQEVLFEGDNCTINVN